VLTWAENNQELELLVISTPIAGVHLVS